MSFFDDEPARPQSTAPRVTNPRTRALIITAVILVVLFFLLTALTGVLTDRMWFNSVGYGEVFGKLLGTKVMLFVVFGTLFGGFVFANIFAAYRTRPVFRPASSEQVSLDRYREVVEPLRKWIAIGLSALLGLFSGTAAAGSGALI